MPMPQADIKSVHDLAKRSFQEERRNKMVFLDQNR